MKRTPLHLRQLPSYTRGEEVFNMVSHIVGAAFGVVALTWCVVQSALKSSGFGIASGIVYGLSVILLYTMSCIYHGLRPNMGKKVMQVLDHCTIYYLIAGTYTPVLLCGLRPEYPGWAWTMFGVVWGCAAAATVFTAIDLKKYAKLSMICYLAMGWCVVIALKPTIAAVPAAALLWILAGGIVYTVGAVLYGLGKKRRWMHSIFHICCLVGTVFQFVGIIAYIL